MDILGIGVPITEKRELIGSLNIVSLPYLRDVFRRILR
jgi:hypothetical protein